MNLTIQTDHTLELGIQKKVSDRTQIIKNVFLICAISQYLNDIFAKIFSHNTRSYYGKNSKN